MAHFIRVLKAIRLRRKWTQFQKEKTFGLLRGEDESDEELESESRSKFRRKFDNSSFGKFFNKARTPNTIENVVVKSSLGFIGGVLLTYIFFFFLYVGIRFSLRSTTYICGVAGIILSIGLAFSSKVRCYVFLLLPVFFSKQGRQALLTYALFLALTGPAKNVMHNMGILSDSMACGQEMVKRTLKQVIEMVKAPFRSIKETLQKISKAAKEAIDSVKAFVMKIQRIIVSILNVIKKATTWLGSIINFCNKKIGTPFQRCMKTFDDAIADCKAKLGVMDFLCHVVHVVKALCYTVKWLDFICMFTEFVSDKVIGAVKRKLKEFRLHMKNLFYVSIELSHTYEFETVASNSTREIARTIVQKINEKVEKVQDFFSFFGFVFSLFFLFVFFKVYYYKYKYLSSDRFDNVYISKYITQLDLKRAQMNRETVLPLEPREKKIYAKPSSLRLLKNEKTRIAGSMFFLTLTSFKILSFVVCDYCLFWVLLTIYEAGLDVNNEIEKAKVGIHVQGQGVLANFYKKLGKTFQIPENPNLYLNPLHCLPDPVPPDTGRYIQIGFLVALCWLLTVTEAYGLRLRNVVMSHYYPERARERAVWLYNHILRTRGSFIRFARRQLRRQFQGGQPTEKVTLTQRLFASFPLLGILFGKNKESACLLCGAPETKNNPLKRCKTPDCPGRYCLKCFASLENICTVCQHPVEYGDLSDISEEIDSSEEEYYKTKFQERARAGYDSDESRRFKTFKDMEFRDSFRDAESNKKIDYAKLSDLQGYKSNLQKKIKEVLKNHIQTLEAEKTRSLKYTKYDYKKLKSKVQDLISRIAKKKSEGSIRKSALVKGLTDRDLKSRERYFRGLGSEESAPILTNPRHKKQKKNTVSFKVEEETIPTQETRLQYEKLKDKITARIQSLKEKKSL